MGCKNRTKFRHFTISLDLKPTTRWLQIQVVFRDPPLDPQQCQDTFLVFSSDAKLKSIYIFTSLLIYITRSSKRGPAGRTSLREPGGLGRVEGFEVFWVKVLFSVAHSILVVLILEK